MRFAYQRSLVAFFTLCLALSGLTFSAIAQNAPSLAQPTPNPAIQQGPLTGKERLGRKWMDEQRMDNCNVPIENRGSKPRPSACHYVPSG